MPCFPWYGIGDFGGSPVNEVLFGTPAIVSEYSTRPSSFQLIPTTAIEGAVTCHPTMQDRQLAFAFLLEPDRWLPKLRPDQGRYDLAGSQYAWHAGARMRTGAGKVEIFNVFGAIVGPEPR